MKRKLVWVRWVDSCFMGEHWRTISDGDLDENGFLMESAGILIRDDSVGLLIATDLDPDDGKFRYTCFIPKAMVRKKKVFIVDA